MEKWTPRPCPSHSFLAVFSKAICTIFPRPRCSFAKHTSVCLALIFLRVHKPYGIFSLHALPAADAGQLPIPRNGKNTIQKVIGWSDFGVCESDWTICWRRDRFK